MFTLTRKLLPIISLLALTACTHVATAGEDTAFTTNTSAASVTFRSLRVEHSNGAANLIKGQIYRTGHNPVRYGHVDYAVLDAQGKVREEGWVEHSSAIRLRNIHRPSLFSINLKQPLMSGDKIQLTYHTESHSQAL